MARLAAARVARQITAELEAKKKPAEHASGFVL
jgi:hypothetical protein